MLKAHSGTSDMPIVSTYENFAVRKPNGEPSPAGPSQFKEDFRGALGPDKRLRQQDNNVPRITNFPLLAL